MKILIVDDSSAILEMLKYLFKDLVQNIVTAQDGEEALKNCQEQDFDLIISDLEMPNMNGILFGHALRKINSTTPIIFYSGHGKLSVQYAGDIQGIKKSILVEDKKTSNLLQAFEAFLKGALFP